MGTLAVGFLGIAGSGGADEGKLIVSILNLGGVAVDFIGEERYGVARGVGLDGYPLSNWLASERQYPVLTQHMI